MRWLLVRWLLLSSRLWLLGCVACSSLRTDVGRKRFHWSTWQPWLCNCDLHKQARVRHLVAHLSPSLEAKEFWEEQPCSLQECGACEPEDCPDGSERSGPGPSLETVPSVNPHDSEIPLAPSSDLESYDSFPVADDLGAE